MPEWRRLVRQRLAGLDLRPVDEIDIVEELAQHIEDRFCDFQKTGMTEEDALGRTLEELDGECLTDELLDALKKA